MLSHDPQLRKANHVNTQARDGDFNHLNNPDLTAGCRHWQGQQHLRARWGGNWSSFAHNKTTLMKNRNGVSVWLLSLSSYLIILKPSPYLGEEQEGCSGWSLEKLTELTQKHQLNQAPVKMPTSWWCKIKLVLTKSQTDTLTLSMFFYHFHLIVAQS